MYNSAATIERCLSSVIRQTYTDVEIIVIDDGSTDNGAQIVRDMAGEDDRIRVIRQENGGVSRARNRGLEEARGDWVCFIDSDDAVVEDYLSKLYDAVQETNCDIAMCGYRAVGTKGFRDHVLSEEKEKTLTGEMREDLVTLRDFISSPCMKIFRRERIEAMQLRFREDMVLAEDRYFNNHYYSQCRTVSFVNRPQYIYFRGNTGLHTAANQACFENEMLNLEYMIRYMEDAEIKRREYIIAEYMCQCINRYVRLPGEKDSMLSSCRRLKRIRQYDKPVKLKNRYYSRIYRLLRLRLFPVIYIYICYWVRRKAHS